MQRYEEHPPPDALSALVQTCWAFTAPADQPAAPYLLPPDGCFNLAVIPEEPHVVLVGPHPGPLAVTIGPGYRVRGARLRPEAGGGLLTMPPRTWTGKVVPLAEAIPDIAAPLAHCPSLDATFNALLGALQALLPALPPPDERIRRAVAAIEDAGGDVRIDALAASLGISPRTLQRRFLATTGLPPKTYARVRRFLLATAVNVLRAEPDPWGRIAAEHGFADQAHLARECTELTGAPPTAFAARMQQIEHVDVKP